ncbi:MFS general substrate transporter [Dacryopinax primogenitus]|uniref:MFS general substrate transporter n=1 Tax=Dacryopinax primogenitus (strain DJM 731) TaxID=1858805 RepID=M5FTQ0_DACPD|nr:MFS general substrate transporter [Dacryopinax primogenitus]EJT98804.1 MFS general substrate transporter [Dacryopinax primogenitus]
MSTMSYEVLSGHELHEEGSHVASAIDDNELDDDVISDDRSALDKTIDRIGMGWYQWSLLALCGFGWMADNVTIQIYKLRGRLLTGLTKMWLQGVAVVLPRVQDHFHVPDSRIGILSSSIFFGMMIGAVGWGTCADLMGRRVAFQFTLLFAAVFGLLCPLMPNFGSSCLCFFFLGSAVGGSMPTDGTLFIENVPHAKRYLLTALSIFFSFGAVVSSILGVVLIPKYSCPENQSEACDVGTENLGWKYMLAILGLFTSCMCLARIVLFRMRESPRYLVASGRHIEAVHSLRKIISFNGHDYSLTIDDIMDAPQDVEHQEDVRYRSNGITRPPTAENSEMEYHSTSLTPDVHLTYTHTFATPVEEQHPHFPRAPTPSPLLHVHHKVKDPRIGSIPIIGRPLAGWLERMEMLFTPEWKKTTICVWGAWALIALSYTLFNVFLPKLLESRAIKNGGGGRAQALNEYLFYALAGVPGPLLGAWMIETKLGRKGSLLLSTVFTGVCTVAFVPVQSETTVIAVTMAISLGATTMWAVLYGMTPEIFSTEVRGSATGMASALSRIAGMAAPLLGGWFLAISPGLPIYASSIICFAAGACALPLPRDTDYPSVRGIPLTSH